MIKESEMEWNKMTLDTVQRQLWYLAIPCQMSIPDDRITVFQT